MKRALLIGLLAAMLLPVVALSRSDSIAACNPTAQPPYVGLTNYAEGRGSVGANGGCNDVTWYMTIKLQRGTGATIAQSSGGPFTGAITNLTTSRVYCINEHGGPMDVRTYLYINVESVGKGSFSEWRRCQT